MPVRNALHLIHRMRAVRIHVSIVTVVLILSLPWLCISVMHIIFVLLPADLQWMGVVVRAIGIFTHAPD